MTTSAATPVLQLPPEIDRSARRHFYRHGVRTNEIWRDVFPRTAPLDRSWRDDTRHETALREKALNYASSRSSFRRILGVNFFTGDAAEAIHRLDHGGLVVVPAAPALIHLPDDRDYREALLGADLVLTDSSYMVLVWNLLQGDSIPRLSGLRYLTELLKDAQLRRPHNTFLDYAEQKERPYECRVAAAAGHRSRDRRLLYRSNLRSHDL